ncbi:MAG TPA: histidine kinase N-terminal domain-containing protein [Egibacteraceae bacterium]|nr:histidine kinase N-terminal domain-containing protein [Egibacteraceae bacterium]
MSPLQELLAERSSLDVRAVDHLLLLLADWQLLADLSFADLLLFVPETGVSPPAYLCAGQMRPYTAQTIYHEDLVGTSFPVRDRPMVGRALAEGRVIRDADPDWSTGVPVREEAIPVRFDGRLIAVVTREANVSTARSPSQLELTYLQSAGELAQMLADGTFPYRGDDPQERELSPRVGDGIMRLNADGVVTYASPNAISAYRRLGSLPNVVGRELSSFDPGHAELAAGLAGGVPVETEIEDQGAVVQRRLLPLIGQGGVVAGLLLVREVTELRRHERALRVKDATIREIHHRVKNNLQTVASLLRLQSRRLRSQEAREALTESVRRISSIALVHETLSQESRQRVNFDKVARRVIDMLSDGLVNPDVPVVFETHGAPGDLPAEVATPLALVLTELLQNSVEHGFPEKGGKVTITFERGPVTLRVLLADDGVGLPEGETLEARANLGLQIARTLVETELGGTFTPSPGAGEGRGLAVELVLPLP